MVSDTIEAFAHVSCSSIRPSTKLSVLPYSLLYLDVLSNAFEACTLMYA